jgi:hypothetical protein
MHDSSQENSMSIVYLTRVYDLGLIASITALNEFFKEDSIDESISTMSHVAYRLC